MLCLKTPVAKTCCSRPWQQPSSTLLLLNAQRAREKAQRILKRTLQYIARRVHDGTSKIHGAASARPLAISSDLLSPSIISHCCTHASSLLIVTRGFSSFGDRKEFWKDALSRMEFYLADSGPGGLPCRIDLGDEKEARLRDQPLSDSITEADGINGVLQEETRDAGSESVSESDSRSATRKTDEPATPLGGEGEQARKEEMDKDHWPTSSGVDLTETRQAEDENTVKSHSEETMSRRPLYDNGMPAKDVSPMPAEPTTSPEHQADHDTQQTNLHEGMRQRDARDDASIPMARPFPGDAGVHPLRTTESPATLTPTVEPDRLQGGGDIVVVTGGSGFLGQHIVKQIHERASHVSEIWIYDVKKFERKLDYQETKKVKYIEGSVTDAKFLAHSLKGATSVIHVAGLISWGTFPDFQGMEEVNVKGTLNVVNACLENNIQRLVYCSTVDVAIGSEPIRGGDETNTPVPDKFLFPGYPDTKFHGERIVLDSANLKTSDGKHVQSVILRANVCYGELDTSYVTNALRSAEKNKGILQQIGDGTAMFQQAYVGNTAWAFVCADLAMKKNPDLRKEIFYIPDNTPIQNSFNFIRPYLEANNMRLSDKSISYPLVYGAVSITEKLVKGLSPLVRLSLPFQSHTIAYINTDFYFCGAKAKRLLGFEPIYSPNEARVLSMKYYTNMDRNRESSI
ncbi:3 beta-hydroxysteroid dehydrogenase [Biomphalaria glabrata]|nr:3 beta-hydroxysteroid dehydrogenase [Biomphalaria glabrata]